MTERIQRIFVSNTIVGKQTLAFDLEQFVSYNLDDKLLTLTNGFYHVHPDSEDRLIRAYQQYFRNDRNDCKKSGDDGVQEG